MESSNFLIVTHNPAGIVSKKSITFEQAKDRLNVITEEISGIAYELKEISRRLRLANNRDLDTDIPMLSIGAYDLYSGLERSGQVHYRDIESVVQDEVMVNTLTTERFQSVHTYEVEVVNALRFARNVILALMQTRRQGSALAVKSVTTEDPSKLTGSELGIYIGKALAVLDSFMSTNIVSVIPAMEIGAFTGGLQAAGLVLSKMCVLCQSLDIFNDEFSEAYSIFIDEISMTIDRQCAELNTYLAVLGSIEEDIEEQFVIADDLQELLKHRAFW